MTEVWLVRCETWNNYELKDYYIMLFDSEGKAIEYCEDKAGNQVNEVGTYISKTKWYKHPMEWGDGTLELTIQKREVK